MSIKSTPEGYLVDIRPRGREGKRIRKRFKTKSEAQVVRALGERH